MNQKNKILICGAQGMVGKALARLFLLRSDVILLTPSRQDLDMTSQDAVNRYLMHHRPDWVIMAAAKVGGIYANMSYPVDFLYDNAMMTMNLMKASFDCGVDNFLFLGSTCIYPKLAPQPIKEESLLTSSLEVTNEAYALAKIMGAKLCSYYRQQYGKNYFCVMPSNLYGPFDNYHPLHSHVLPALIKRCYEVQQSQKNELVIWGTGSALREFLYVDDLAQACLFLMEHNREHSLINVGSDDEVSILDLTKLIAQEFGFQGSIIHDLSKPDGTPRKKTDLTKIHSLGWKATTSLQKGIPLTIQDFCLSVARGTLRS